MGEVDLEEIHRLGLGFCRIVEPVIEANVDAIHLNYFGGLDQKSVGRRRVKLILRFSEGLRLNLAV